MFIRKKKLEKHIEKRAEKLYRKEIDELERGHIKERKQIIKEFSKRMTRLRTEKNKALDDANRFYELYRDIPIKILSVWNQIDRFKRMESEEKARQISLSGAIEHELLMLDKKMSNMDGQANRLLEVKG